MHISSWLILLIDVTRASQLIRFTDTFLYFTPPLGLQYAVFNARSKMIGSHLSILHGLQLKFTKEN